MPRPYHWQSEEIRSAHAQRAREVCSRSQPWRASTGPKTPAGKNRSAKNARRHGQRSRKAIAAFRAENAAARLVGHAVAYRNRLLTLSLTWMAAIERGRATNSRTPGRIWREAGDALTRLRRDVARLLRYGAPDPALADFHTRLDANPEPEITAEDCRLLMDYAVAVLLRLGNVRNASRVSRGCRAAANGNLEILLLQRRLDRLASESPSAIADRPAQLAG